MTPTVEQFSRTCPKQEKGISVYAVCREKELLETPVFWGATTTEAISCVVEEFKHTIDVTSDVRN